MEVKVRNESKNNLPQYQTVDSAGVDLQVDFDRSNFKDVIESIDKDSKSIILLPLERRLCMTGLFIELPKGCEAQIRPRSGLALKHGITVLNSPGTIDADYRGEIGVILVNLSSENYILQDRERVAQMVFQKVEQAEFKLKEELSETERGRGGFGHTGK